MIHVSDDSEDRRAGDSDATDEEREESRDPFDSFDEYGERSGDPFDALGDDQSVDDGRGVPGDPTASDSSAESDPFEYVDEPGHSPDDPAETERRDPGTATPDPDPQIPDEQGGDTAGDPLADVEVSGGDPFQSNASAFERSDVDGIDPDDVWARLTDSADAETGSESAAGAEDRQSTDEDDVVQVSKHSYCEGCEHFSPPPDVECGHEGTEILEFVDIDTVEVANCPVVAERRELEDEV